MKKLCITDSIFCSSAVKANIADAMTNPVNAPLVQQLSEYVNMPDGGDAGDVEEKSIDQVQDDNVEYDRADDTEADESSVDAPDDVSDEPLSNIVDMSDIDGVSRIETKGAELWVYIDDSLSPDSIMQNIIDAVSRLDPSMKFNRLARSYNAVVFAE